LLAREGEGRGGGIGGRFSETQICSLLHWRDSQPPRSPLAQNPHPGVIGVSKEGRGVRGGRKEREVKRPGGESTEKRGGTDKKRNVKGAKGEGSSRGKRKEAGRTLWGKV